MPLIKTLTLISADFFIALESKINCILADEK